MRLKHFASFIFAAFLFLSGCLASTSYKTPLGNCLVNFTTHGKVMMAEIPGLSTYASAQLYQIFEKEARQADVLPAYAVEQEMDLRLHQIKPSADTASLAALQKLGYAYYLKVDVEGKEAEETYTHATVQEISEARQKMAQGVVQREPDPTKARLTFSLYTTDERRLIYSQITTTEMRALPLPEQDGDQSSVNLSSAAQAIEKAFTKGSRQLLKNCQ